ncbi:MAG: hypothetical protein KIS66_03675 [Fimbriimonadaceae bacterium]|nr:hypothetical protein [Fimbriimonadaceae bacterium]
MGYPFLKLSSIGCGLVVAALSSAQYSFSWQRFYDGPLHLEDNLQGIALDPSGNTYVVGSVNWTTWNPDIQVLKYDPAGALVWERRIDGEANGQDLGFGIAFGGDGSVNIVARTVTNTTGSDILTVKFRASDGATLWSRTYDGPAHSIDDGFAIEADAVGNVFVVGEVWNDAEFYSNGDYATLKYDQAGNLVWARLFDGPASWIATSDQPVAIALDGHGDVVVTGNSPTINLAADWATVKYRGSDGTLLWEAHYSSGVSGVPTSLEIGKDNDVYVGGSQNAVVIARYDGATGSAKWVKEDGFPHAGRLRNRWALTLDPTDNPVISVTYDGDSDDSNLNNNVQTTKYDAATGERLWSVQYGGMSNLDGQYAGQVLCQPNGDVLMVGTERLGPAPYKFLLLKYKGDTGDLLWTGTFDQPFGGANPRRSRFDAAGDLLVGAITNSATNNPDISVLKFAADPIDLAPIALWRRSGLAVSGGLTEIGASDDLVLKGAFEWLLDRQTPNLSWEIGATSPTPAPARLDLTFECRTSQAGLRLELQVKNHVTGKWDTVGVYGTTLVDAVREVSITEAAARYVGAGGAVQLRASFRPVGPTQRVVTASVDHVRFAVTG